MLLRFFYHTMWFCHFTNNLLNDYDNNYQHAFWVVDSIGPFYVIATMQIMCTMVNKVCLT
jgi:hypothetical protein